MDTVVVMLSKNFDMNDLDQLIPNFMRWGATDIVRRYPRLKMATFKVEGSTTIEQFASQALKNPMIEAVERLSNLRLSSSLAGVPRFKVFHTRLIDCWHLEDLDRPSAHRKTKGFGASVAVIDTGIGFHERLPSTDFKKISSTLVARDPFWQEPATQELLYQKWHSTLDMQELHRRKLYIWSKHTAAYRSLTDLPAFKYLEDNIFKQKAQGKPVVYPPGCPSGIVYEAIITEITLEEFATFHRLMGMSAAEEAAFDKACEQLMRAVFETDYTFIAKDFRSKFAAGSEREFLYELLYKSKVWLSEPELRAVSIHSKSFVQGDQSLFDYDGHGTAVASILCSNELGICPHADVVILKIFDSAGNADTGDLLAAIEYAMEIDVDIVHIGVEVDDNSSIAALTRACADAWNAGLLLVAPAGNQGQNVSMPASLDSVVAVASVTVKQTLSDFSNRGPEIDIAAFGGGSWYTSSGSAKMRGMRYTNFSSLSQWDFVGIEDREYIITERIGGGFEFCQGTSFASAQVTAAAALIKSLNPSASNKDLRNKVKSSVLKHTDPSLGMQMAGTGILDLASI